MIKETSAKFQNITQKALFIILCAVLAYEIWFATLRALNGGVTWPQDQAIFSQVMWKICHGKFDSTIYSEHNFFASHFTPLFILLSPISFLFKSIPLHYLFVVLTLCISLYYIFLTGIKIYKDKTVILLSLVVYVTTPSFFNFMTSGFRDVTLSVLPVTLAIYFFFKEKWYPYVISLLFAMLCREDIALSLIGFSFAAFVLKYDRKWIFSSFIIPLCYFIIVVKFAMPWLADDLGKTGGLGFDKYNYLGTSLSQIILGAVKHPGLVLNQIWHNRSYILGLLVSWCFLPLLSPTILLIPIGNFAEVILANGVTPTADLKYWYIAPSIPFFIIAFYFTLKKIKIFQHQWIAITVLVLGILINIFHFKILNFNIFLNHIISNTGNSYKDTALVIKYANANPDASVAASYNTILFFSQREHAYLIGNIPKRIEPDIIVSEVSSLSKGYNRFSDLEISWPINYSSLNFYIEEKIQSGKYNIDVKTDSIIILKKNKDMQFREYTYQDYISNLTINIFDMPTKAHKKSIQVKMFDNAFFRCFENRSNFIVYGPYIQLPPGDYKISVPYYIHKEIDAPVDFQVYSNKNGIISSKSIMKEFKSKGLIELNFSSQGEDDFEFRVFSSKKVSICLGHITLQNIEFKSVQLPVFDLNSEQLKNVKNDGTPWNSKGNYTFSTSGICFLSKEKVKGDFIEISIDNNDTYNVKFYADDNLLENYTIPALLNFNGLKTRRIAIKNKPFNKIEIIPEAGDGLYSVGHLLIF